MRHSSDLHVDFGAGGVKRGWEARGMNGWYLLRVRCPEGEEAQRSFPPDGVGSSPEQGKVVLELVRGVLEQVRGVQLANGFIFRCVYISCREYLLTDAGLGPGGGGGGALGGGGGSR